MAFLNSIKIKILIVSIGLAAIPVIAVSVLLGMQATSAAEHALESQVANQLISIREIKKGQIENYLKAITREETKGETEITPLVKSLRGSFTAPDDFDYKQVLSKSLSEKYL